MVTVNIYLNFYIRPSVFKFTYAIVASQEKSKLNIIAIDWVIGGHYKLNNDLFNLFNLLLFNVQSFKYL